MYALEINQVNKVYGNKFKALDNVNFKLNHGDFVGLLGVNGAGKTSLISSIAGINSFHGEIKIMGHNVLTDLVNAKRQLGVVPQELAFDPFLTVMQTLKFQSGLYGVVNNQAWLEELIERMHLTDKIHSNTRSLSGGMKRRLMVAQALVHKPKVIILDEPTVGVDVEIRKNIWEFITKLHNEGHTILLTTHYLEEVEQLCNKIIMIDKGKIITESSKSELIDKANGLPSTLQIETENGQFITELEGLILTKESNKYTLKLENNKTMMDVVGKLIDAGIVIENININRPNLEDIFLDYLGR